MSRPLAGALLGWIIGLGLTVVLLRSTASLLPALTDRPPMAIEHSTIYLALVLGSGFGSLTGAVVGLARLSQESGVRNQESGVEEENMAGRGREREASSDAPPFSDS